MSEPGSRSRTAGFLDSSRAGRFALVGVVNTIIDLVLFGLLSIAGVPMFLANFVSTTAGMTFGFFAHRAYSFRSTQSLRSTVVPFVLTTGAGLWIVQPLVIWGASEVLGAVAGESALTQIWLPKTCAIGIGLAWNYLLYRFVVFSSRRRAAEAP